MTRHLWAFAALLVLPAVALAADPAKKPDEKKKPDFQPWSKVGKEMTVTQKGLWNIHQDKKKTKTWIEIPSSQLNKPFLVATSVAGGTRRAGWQWNDWLVVFKKHAKKLVLLERNVGFKGGDSTLSEVVQRTYTDRVLATYPIVAKGPNGGWVIDAKRVFASGATLFFGGLGRAKDASLASFEGSKTFPKNTEISVEMPSARNGQLIRLHYSISMLPKTGYKPRVADDRIGYFLTVLKDFSEKNKDDNRYLRYINRWHLEKRDSKLDLSPPKVPIKFYIEKSVPVRMRRYVKEGILEWNKAFEKVGFIDAIEVIQQTKDNEHKDKDPEDVRYNFFRWITSGSAFAMGPSRVNPLTGQILDADIIFDDDFLRYSLKDYRLRIREVPKTAIGPRGAKLLPQHPFSRLGLVAEPDEVVGDYPEDAPRPLGRPAGRRAFCSIGKGMQHELAMSGLWLAGDGPKVPSTKEYPEEFIGQVIKDTVMHEVGHTLGLRHNFKSSIWRSLSDVHSAAKPGDIAGSVMDYNAIPISPDKQQQGNWAMRTLGPYDVWAIEFGYTTKDKELKKIVSRVAERGLDYGTDEDTWSADPLINRWDLGADPLEYSRQQIAVLNQLKKDIEARAVAEGEDYRRLRRAFNMLLFSSRSAGYRAVRFVGGEHIHRDHRGDPNARPAIVPTDAAKQKEALRFVCDEILSGKYFDFKPELLGKLAPDFWGDDWMTLFMEGHSYPYLDNVLRVQASLVYGLTSPDRLTRVLDARIKVPADQDVLTAPDVFDSLEATIFGDVAAAVNKPSTNQKPAIPIIKRNLQREYVSHLTYMLLRGDGWYPPSVQTLTRHYVKRLAEKTGEALKSGKGMDTYTRAHLEECQARLTRALEASYTLD